MAIPLEYFSPGKTGDAAWQVWFCEPFRGHHRYSEAFLPSIDPGSPSKHPSVLEMDSNRYLYYHFA
jgi:hypothetical protein